MAASTRTRELILNRIGVLSAAKIQGTIFALFGLIFGVILTLITLIGLTVGTASGQAQQPEFAAGMGAFSIIFLPIFYGIAGFIGGAIAAFFYNLVAKWVGGIVMEFKQN